MESYKEKYEQALKIAQETYDTQPMYREWLEKMFPELAESEDEKVRQKILFLFYAWRNNEQVNIPNKKEVEKTITWLEKQGEKVEPKSVWSEEDEEQLDRALYMMEQLDMTKSWDDVYNWLKSLKDRFTWKPSDEQIKVCKEVYADILSAKGFDLGTVNSELNRLEEELRKLKEK